jgi:molybdopterin-guanine dinucleotide biosynthesis protein A
MIAVVILSAGESRRMGRPKALLSFPGQLLSQTSNDSQRARRMGPPQEPAHE